MAVLYSMLLWVMMTSLFLLGIGSRSAAAQAAGPKDIDPKSGMRLPPLTKSELDDFGKKVYDLMDDDAVKSDDGLSGPSGVRIYSPEIAEHYHLANQYLRRKTGFGNRLTELAILNAAREGNSQYEWTAHESAGLRAGLEQEIIDIVKHRKDLKSVGTVKGLGEKETLIIRLGREMLREKKVGSETFAEAVRLFGRKGTVELGSLMAHYYATAAMLTLVDIQLRPGQKPGLPLP